jgi:ABC-type antimicrobial peptide transport system permease subunit
MMYIEEALRVLFANKIRSFLTVIGLIIGVAAVIAIQVLGKGMAGAVSGTLGTLNDNSFIVLPNGTQADFRKAAIRLSDLAYIKQSVPGIVEAIPAGGTRDLVHVGHEVHRFVIHGDSVNRFNKQPLAEGRTFMQSDIDDAASVSVLTDNAYKKLFPDGEDALGKSVYAGDARYIVVGVLAPPPTGLLNATFGGDVSIPYTTYINKYLHGKFAFAGNFTVGQGVDMPTTEVAVINELKRLHENTKGAQYQTFDKATFSNGINQLFNVLTIVVGLIGAVSLLVAGIGIMNIMLVSVTERTREIGVRKAIGAKRGQILIQFFIEALALSSIGCGIGLVIGLAIGWAVNQFAIVKLTGYVAPIPWVQASVIAVTFATVVTLAFGTYPAYRAAALDPIEALRYE